MCVCAEAARTWQRSDIGPVALHSLCQLSQANVDASLTLPSLPSEWRSGHFGIMVFLSSLSLDPGTCAQARGSTLAVRVFGFYTFASAFPCSAGAPAERCYISAPLGLSQRWTRRLSPAGSGVRTGMGAGTGTTPGGGCKTVHTRLPERIKKRVKHRRRQMALKKKRGQSVMGK